MTLYADLREDEKKFFNYFRMSIQSFDELIGNLASKLERSSLRRIAICSTERLAITLRYDQGDHSHARPPLSFQGAQEYQGHSGAQLDRRLSAPQSARDGSTARKEKNLQCFVNTTTS